MTRYISKGKCSLCNGAFNKAVITRHVKACKQQKLANAKSESKIPKKTKIFHLVVEGDQMPEYWLHIGAQANAKLYDLDKFLREIWLECCGHLSDFTINGQSYSAHPDEGFNNQDMDIFLGEVLVPKMKFYHQYDYGTTTSLKLKVVSEWEGEKLGRTVSLLARNEPPVIKCSFCESVAVRICPDCIWNYGQGCFCDKCGNNKHECDEDMLLPLVNSPRVGMCAYTG